MRMPASFDRAGSFRSRRRSLCLLTRLNCKNLSALIMRQLRRQSIATAITLLLLDPIRQRPGCGSRLLATRLSRCCFELAPRDLLGVFSLARRSFRSPGNSWSIDRLLRGLPFETEFSEPLHVLEFWVLRLSGERLLPCGLRRDQEAGDGSFPERFARFQPMKPLDQDEAVFFTSNDNRFLLSDVQNALRYFLYHFGFERFPYLFGDEDLFDWKAFRFEHSVYSVVIEPTE
jgi:hypothetical protein